MRLGKQASPHPGASRRPSPSRGGWVHAATVPTTPTARPTCTAWGYSSKIFQSFRRVRDPVDCMGLFLGFSAVLPPPSAVAFAWGCSSTFSPASRAHLFTKIKGAHKGAPPLAIASIVPRAFRRRMGKNGPVHTPLRERPVLPYFVRRAWSTAFLNSAVIASAMPWVGLTSK